MSHAFNVLLTVIRVADEHEIKYPAAALAYYAFVSLIPLLILVFALFRDRLVRRVQATTPVFLTPDAHQLISEAVTATSGRAWAALLASGVLAWSGANIVIGFQSVIERVEHDPKSSLRNQLRAAGSILGSFGLVIISIIIVSLLFELLPMSRKLAYGEPVVQLGLLTLAFLPLYYAPSRVVTSATEALPGALLAAVGWTVLLTAIRFYAGNASQYALYGVLSGIIIILTSLYLAAVILMMGVVVNTVNADTDSMADSSWT